MTSKFFVRLSDDLIRLLKESIDYNVTIEIGEAPNNQIFKVHSYILQSRSPYFKNKFNETPFNKDHIKSMYIYGGIISLEKLENSTIFDLLIASNKLELDELVEHLQTYLVNNHASWLRLKFDRIYRTSYQVKNLEIIQDFYNDIIAKHPNTSFESENFDSLPEDALISIIKRDDLQKVEGKIWEYVIKWGKAKNSTLPDNLDKWTSDNFLTLKETLKGCLPYIRYFSLDINSKIMTPNKPISSKVLPTRTIPDSNILTIEHFLEILSWIDRQEPYYTENIWCKFELLAKGSKDGFDINTVIVLKVEGTGEILGGYNPFSGLKKHMVEIPLVTVLHFLLRYNLKTSKLCYCRINGESFDKPIRSAGFLSLDHRPPSSDKSTFSVEEYEIFKVSKRNYF
ncbi:hypothetical protein Glove_313g67 [Diversispora epigaea]|uniref:BTB domain-containing protein n=1 Tax=Diversispora epigaea TaxID=1348612 RepID=A0A397HYH1_9GLOM|nr:hypothetical protein Glove_313g67 [Diversispora epigaea]